MGLHARGVPHGFRVVGDHAARILLVHDNASFRDFIHAVGVPAASRVVPIQPTFPPVEEMVGLASSHDLRPTGPPMTAEDADSVLAALP